MSSTAYQGSDTVRWPDDSGPWAATVHWARLDGALVCVGLDLRSFTGEGELASPVSAQAGWQLLDARSWRVPLAKVVAKARPLARRRLTRQLGQVARQLLRDGKQLRAAPGTVITLDRRTPGRRRGPEPLASDEELRRIVLPAVADAGGLGASGVREAVRKVVQDHLPGYRPAATVAGPGQVTDNQVKNVLRHVKRLQEQTDTTTRGTP